MTYCFDLDGTLCTNTDGCYDQAEPFPEVIEEVNRLRALGHHIIVFTARGSGTGIDWTNTTKKQLQQWSVSYDKLMFGKPAADVYVDDKAVNISEFRLARLGLLTPNIAPAMTNK